MTDNQTQSQNQEAVIQQVSFPGSPEKWELEITEAKVRGEDKYVSRGLLKFPVDKFEFVQKLANAIGVPTFVGAVYRELIRPASIEASAAAYNEETGEFSVPKWIEAFIDYFLPGERAKGMKLGDINKRMAELAALFVEFMTLKNKGQPITPEMQNKVAQATLEFQRLGELKAKKERHGAKIQEARRKNAV